MTKPLLPVEQSNIGGSETPTEDVKEQHAILGAYAAHLNGIAKLAYNDPDLAKQRLDGLIVPGALIFLKDAVWGTVVWCRQSRSGISERTISDVR